MRIGYDTLVENPLHPSSAINYIKSVLRAMVEIGPEHEYFVFVSPKNYHHFDIKAPNVHLVNCHVSNENIPLRILIQQFYYPLMVRRHKLDVIHALSQIPLITNCATVVKICGLHHHLTPQEYLRGISPRNIVSTLRLVYRRLVWDSSAHVSTLVMANTETTRADITRLMGIPSEKIKVVLEAVDDTFGSVDLLQAKAQLGERLNITRDYILYVSNLWYYKNPDGAIRAFARQYTQYHDDLELLIVGPDDYGRIPELKALAEQCGVGDRVRFTGKVSFHDLLNLYTAARVVFYPSLAETFGKPVVEGMRAGVPVVAANATCLPEIVGDAGLLVDPTDDDAMATALHKAATDETLRQLLIERGNHRGLDFSWQATARGTLNLCTEAVTRYRKGA